MIVQLESSNPVACEGIRGQERGRRGRAPDPAGETPRVASRERAVVRHQESALPFSSTWLRTANGSWMISSTGQ